MPIDAGAIPLIGIVFMLMFGGKKKKKGPAGVSCPPFEWQPEQVDLAISAGIESGICTVGELTANVADAVYPTAPNGQRVNWPKETPWVPPVTAEGEAACLWDEIEDRVRERLEGLPPDACVPPVDPPEIIMPFISNPGKPRSGTFYQIRLNDPRDMLSWVARTVIGTRPGDKLNAPVIRCITASDWNLNLYGTPYDSESRTFKRYTAVMVDGDPVVISKSFLPRNENAKEAMFAGRMPQRTIAFDKAGSKLGIPNANSYGFIWIPVMRVVDDVLVCPEGEWSDGRSKSEPPPEVMAAIT